VGPVVQKRGEKEQALPLIEEAIAHQKAALQSNPNHPRRLQFLRNHYDLLARIRGGMTERQAEELMRQMIAANRKLSEQYPRVPFYHHELGGYENDLANMLDMRGQREEALRLVRDAINQQKAALAIQDAPKYRDYLARHYFRLAILLERGQRFPEARQAHRDSMAQKEKLVKQAPNHAPYQRALAEHYHEFGLMLLRLGEHAPAEAEFEKALAAWRTLVCNFPDVTNFQADLANALSSRGVLLKDTGRFGEAMKLYDEAVALLEKLARDKPAILGYRRLLARCLDNSALVLHRLGQLDRAIPRQQRAVDLMRPLCKEKPKIRDYRHALATHLFNLGSSCYAFGRPGPQTRLAEADKADRESLLLLQELVKADPRNPEYRADLALVHGNLAGVLTVNLRYREAEEHLRPSLKLSGELVRDFQHIPAHQNDRARNLNGLGILLERAGRPKEAEPYLRDSVKAYEELVARYPRAIEYPSTAWPRGTTPWASSTRPSPTSTRRSRWPHTRTC
jgi:tetratricopeptide (TPR) repeat protein